MNDTVIGVIVGALSTVVTGILSSEYTAWREKARERKAISASLVDELSEMQTIINNMKEVWDKTKTLIPSYIWELKSCFSTYEATRQRFFLIKDKKLRTDVIKLYKDLKLAIPVEGKRAGSLSSTQQSRDEQKEIADKFIGFRDRAGSIIDRLR